MPIQSRLRGLKPREFWERSEVPQGQPPPSPYELPEFDVAGMVQQGIAPVERAYERGRERISSRLSKRKLGESGPYVQAELDEFEKYMKSIGAFAPDLPLKTAQIQMEAARLGLTQDQFMRQMALERERLYAPLAVQQKQWAEEQALRELTQEQRFEIEAGKLGLNKEELELELKKLNLTTEQFLMTFELEKEKAKREWSFTERDFELEAERLDLSKEELRIELEKLNLTEEQFLMTLELEKEKLEKQWGFTEREFELEARKLNMTEEQFNQRLTWEQEMFDRTLTSEDRQFDRQMELNWKQMDLSEQEINDKKEMFYDQLKQYESQFDRDYSLRETEQMQQYETEQRTLDLTEDQIQNQMDQFNKTLEFEMDQYDRTLSWEQRKWADQFTLELDKLDLSKEQYRETIRQFDIGIRESQKLQWGWTDDAGNYHKGTMELQQEQMNNDYDLEQKRISVEEHQAETFRIQVETDKAQNEAIWGWTDENGVFHPGLEQQKMDMMENEIFGYWDEGFKPADFTGDKYTGEYDEQGNRLMTQDWKDYMAEHYHKGQLDLAEWQIWLDSLLGMKGVSNVEEEEPLPPGTYTVLQTQIDNLNGEIASKQGELSSLESIPADMQTVEDTARIAQLQQELTDLRAQLKATQAEQQQWIEQQERGP